MSSHEACTLTIHSLPGARAPPRAGLRVGAVLCQGRRQDGRLHRHCLVRAARHAGHGGGRRRQHGAHAAALGQLAVTRGARRRGARARQALRMGERESGFGGVPRSGAGLRAGLIRRRRRGRRVCATAAVHPWRRVRAQVLSPEVPRFFSFEVRFWGPALTRSGGDHLLLCGGHRRGLRGAEMVPRVSAQLPPQRRRRALGWALQPPLHALRRRRGGGGRAARGGGGSAARQGTRAQRRRIALRPHAPHAAPSAMRTYVACSATRNSRTSLLFADLSFRSVPCSVCVALCACVVVCLFACGTSVRTQVCASLAVMWGPLVAIAGSLPRAGAADRVQTIGWGCGFGWGAANALHLGNGITAEELRAGRQWWWLLWRWCGLARLVGWVLGPGGATSCPVLPAAVTWRMLRWWA